MRLLLMPFLLTCSEGFLSSRASSGRVTGALFATRPRITSQIAPTPRAVEPPPLPAHLEEMIHAVNAGATLLDVREPNEFAAGHLLGATPAPLSAMQSGGTLDLKPGSATYGQMGKFTYPQDRQTGVAIILTQKIYVHCAAGVRAAKAAAFMAETMGYQDVRPLKEGFQELAELDVAEVSRGEAESLVDPN